jgi:hypothetical protein
MSWRRVNITRQVNIADLNQLPHHPNVRRCWVLPWGFVLFEFYDPIFEEAEIDPALGGSHGQSEATRRKLASLMIEERRLLAPLYRGRPEHWQGNKFGLPLKTVIYRVVDDKVIRWPWFGCSPDWEIQRRIRFSGKLGTLTTGTRESLERAFVDWATWAQSIGQLTGAGKFTFEVDKFGALCEFSGPCGDACMGLYLLLTEKRSQSNLEAAGFFDPDEKEMRFLEIGGTGVMP